MADLTDQQKINAVIRFVARIYIMSKLLRNQIAPSPNEILTALETADAIIKAADEGLL